MTNQSVIDYVARSLAPVGTKLGFSILGAVFILFILGYLMYLGASLDLIAAILIPAVFLGIQFGWIDSIVGWVMLIACAGVITYAYLKLAHS